ncbi:MAG: YegS/Rv2252/BmrU family lipid kinase [Bacillota bacterium]|nr:YegS/Rv2252/BmrU family lipid kinase [Bacillota bacterium]
MKKVLFIYNPYSGDGSIKSKIDRIIKIHLQHGYIVLPYRISLIYAIDDIFMHIDEKFEYILIAGGDGTVDNVINVMKKHNIDCPIGILPTGTANDFAKFIRMPKDINKACEQILESKPRRVDIGRINDKYFINVASMGAFTDVSQKIDTNLKNTLGKMAYYVKGIEQFPNIRNLKVNVESKEQNFDGDMYLMFIFNGRTAGNLNLAYEASITDGVLDVIIVKASMVIDIVSLFIKMLKEQHLQENNSIVYFKTNKLKIECNEDIVTDIDGERGPNFPIEIECIKGGISLLGIKK